MIFLRKSELVATDVHSHSGGVIALSLLVAPLVVALATVVERRLGACAGGWVAALPIAFSVAVAAVTLDTGTADAATMALSAATHVPAQIAFGVVFATVLMTRGAVAGLAAGAIMYFASSLLVGDVPVVLALAAAVVGLALAPRLMDATDPRPGAPGRWPATALSCATASLIVGTALVTSRLAGPEIAGAVVAFPSVSTMVALTAARRDGRHAGAHALSGLVRSLPCYLTFCLTVSATAPSLGAPAVIVGLMLCTVIATITWRRVPVARRPALAT